MVVEDRVIDNELHKTVERLRLNAELASKAFRAMNPPVVKKVELRRLWDRRSALKNTHGADLSPQLIIAAPPVVEIFKFKIQD
jgi:hypothetical protein